MRACAHLKNCQVQLIKFKTGHCWSQNFQIWSNFIWFFIDLIFHKVERLRLGFLKLKKHSMQVKNQVWIWLFIGWFCWTRSAQKHFQAKWKIRSASNNSFFHSEPQEKQKTIFKAGETGTFKAKEKSDLDSTIHFFILNPRDNSIFRSRLQFQVSKKQISRQVKNLIQIWFFCCLEKNKWTIRCASDFSLDEKFCFAHLMSCL